MNVDGRRRPPGANADASSLLALPPSHRASRTRPTCFTKVFEPNKPTHRAPPGRLCAAGCAGSSSPPCPRGFSPEPETETCSWFYCFLPSTASCAAAAAAVLLLLLVVAGVVVVVAAASLALVPAPLSGRHLRPGPANEQVTRVANESQAIGVSPVAVLPQLSAAMLVTRHVTSRDSQLSGF